jgi:hypothetical protein
METLEERRLFSLPGLIVSLLAFAIMFFLSRRKLQVASELGSRALRTDAVEGHHTRLGRFRGRRRSCSAATYRCLVGGPAGLSWSCLVGDPRGPRGVGRRLRIKRLQVIAIVPLEAASSASVTNGCADNTRDTSEIPELADPLCATRKSAEEGQEQTEPFDLRCSVISLQPLSR